MANVTMLYMHVLVSVMLAGVGGVSSHVMKMMEEAEPGVLVGNVFDVITLNEQCAGLARTSAFAMEFADKAELDAGDVLMLASNGDLRTKVRVDRDVICPSQVNCVISGELAVLRPSHCFAIASISLQLVDINDNSPRFVPDRATVHLSEASEVDTFVRLPLATDADSPQYGVRHYRLVTSRGIFRLQHVSATDGSAGDVRLVLTARLDREMTSEYELEVVAEDWGRPPHTASLRLTVIVTDVNDETPTFDSDFYNITLSEDFPLNTTFISLRAADGDEGVNGDVRYRLELSQQQGGVSPADNSFYIEPRSGNLSLIKPLDYETARSVKVVVVAYDLATDSRSGSATVVVSVTDTNDNAPRIYINTFTADRTAYVRENMAPGEFVAYLSVTDPDEGAGGEVTCSLQPPGMPFSIITTPNNQYKIVTSKSVDREQTESYNVTVSCANIASVGHQRLVSTQQLIVVIDDVNDCFPEFSAASYVFTVAENNEAGAALGRLTVTDSDAGENGRVELRVSEVEARKYVQLEPDTGILRALLPLDRERLPDLHLTVVAVDGGLPARTSYVTVTVRVLDDNDEYPRFTRQAYRFSVGENMAKHTVVGQVEAHDGDLWPFNTTLYMLDITAGVLPFTIHQISGVITTRQPLDREHAKRYDFDVIAYDKFQPEFRSYASVSVDVGDDNDNAPVITFPANGTATVRMSNLLPPYTSVYQVHAFDADEDAELAFVLVSSSSSNTASGFNVSDYFAIDDTGSVQTVADLSHLTYEQFEVQVTVRDAGIPPLTSTATLILVVDSTVPLPRSGGSGRGGQQLWAGELPLLLLAAVAVASTCLVAAMLATGLIVRCQSRKRRRAWLSQRQAEIKADTGGRGHEASHALQPLMVLCNDNLPPSPVKSAPLYIPNGEDRMAAYYDAHLEAHLLALLKPEDVTSVSSGDVSHADSGRGGSEEGDGTQRLRPSLQHQPQVQGQQGSDVLGTTPSREQVAAIEQHLRDTLRRTSADKQRSLGASQGNSSAVSPAASQAGAPNGYQGNSSTGSLAPDNQLPTSTYEQLMQGVVRSPRSDVNWFANGAVKTFCQSDVRHR